MNLKFNNKKITGILTVLPGKEVLFEDEMENYNFSIEKSLRLKTTMGFNKKRIVEDGITSSDLCIHGLNYLFENNKLNKEDIDAIILVTQTPDHIMPPTSNIIQGHFGLKHDIICLDINQGCAGFMVGLIQAYMLLEQEAISKVVLLNADVLSPKVSKRDRNSNPLIGDGASITIIEKSKDNSPIYCSIKMNGQGAFALQIPAGGAKLPISTETSELKEDANGNFRSQNHLVMKGDEVFNFVQTIVPPMIESILETSQTSKDDIDYYMFHQPNKFMLSKLANRLNIDESKMPNNVVENFGNASGVSIPTAITFNISQLTKQNYKICLAGFGVGLTWTSMVLEMGMMDFCEMIDY